MNQIYPQVWMSQSVEMRRHLAKVFNLERTGVTEVRDQELISDGYTAENLQKITNEAMNRYVGSPETFARAWELTLAKAYSEMHPPLGEITAGGVVPMPDPVVLSETPEIVDKMVEVENPPAGIMVIAEGDPIPEKRWCASCDSKGVRHKKTCPFYEPLILSSKNSDGSED